jgi:hypothetical protein
MSAFDRTLCKCCTSCNDLFHSSFSQPPKKTINRKTREFESEIDSSSTSKCDLLAGIKGVFSFLFNYHS